MTWTDHVNTVQPVLNKRFLLSNATESTLTHLSLTIKFMHLEEVVVGLRQAEVEVEHR